MDPNPSSDPRRNLTRGAIETAIQIGFLILLVGWCIRIVLPFVVPVIWAIVIAVAVHPVHQRLVRALPGHSALAAALLTLLGLAILIVPTVSVSGSAIESGTTLAKALASGELSVPPPPDSVASWPVIGEPIDRLWTLATNNLGDALSRLQPQLEIVGAWLLSAVGGFGAAFFQFVLAVLVAGALLAKAPAATRVARAISRRLSDEHGDDFLQMSVATVRSVAQGVLGIAIIQSLLAGAGMVAAGVPYAGIWALVVLVLAVVQLPTLLVLGPVMVWVFSVSSTTVAVVFTIWTLLVGMSDNFLRPLLLGRGVDVPMFVILIGSIGGMITLGIIGLFLGAVVLALGYKLFLAWLGELPEVESPSESEQERA
ncbi:MAG: AI-2E family transporter [Myxococcales bacterium]|nr:AI-2E family transporter [Myxococcales bacterium]